MKKNLLAVVLVAALLHCPVAGAEGEAWQVEYASLEKQAKKAGGVWRLSEEQHLRLLELRYALGSKEEKSLPLNKARELARLEILSKKSGGLSKLSEKQYQRVLALRIMRGDSYNQPLPPSEANELARLQVEARKLGGESRLATEARQRLKALRSKVCRGGSANLFF